MATRWRVAGLVPHPFSVGFGTGAEVGNRFHSEVVGPRAIPSRDRGESPKSRAPANATRPGLRMSRRGLGGWGPSATVIQIIGSLNGTAKSSLGYPGGGSTRSTRSTRLHFYLFCCFLRLRRLGKGYGEQPFFEAAIDLVDINIVGHLKGALE